MNLLILLFLIPLASSIVAFLVPSKRLAVGLSLLPLALLVYGLSSGKTAEIDHLWLPSLSIRFHLAIDALSLLFLFLTAIVIPMSLLAARSKELSNPNLFYALVLFLQGLLVVFFTARDLVVFTIFWEAMLLPLYFVIALWGGPQRRTAALKFLIYMIAGSAFMVAAVLALYFASASSGAATFDMATLAKIAETVPYAALIAAIFMLAFSVKTPLFPFHAWLPDAYYQAPVAGTIILSAILSKAGIYGFLRIGLGLFPTFMHEWSPLLLGLSIAGVFYGGLAAWMQTDFKRLLAYSSFSHVNFVLAGLFVWNEVAHSGAILQALNHGITITALFLVAGWLGERLQTTSMENIGGLAKYFPHLCWLTLFFVLSSVALPGTNNFVGELMILFGLFGQHPWLAAFLGLTVILSVIYMLRWMQYVYFQTPTERQESWMDIQPRELLIAAPLVLIILWVGIYPAPILKAIAPVTEKPATVAQLMETK